MEDYKVDAKELIKQLKDEAMISLLTLTIPVEEDRTYVENMLRIFLKHGVSVEKAIEILGDMAKLKEGK